jgi:hypothetical protein
MRLKLKRIAESAAETCELAGVELLLFFEFSARFQVFPPAI